MTNKYEYGTFYLSDHLGCLLGGYGLLIERLLVHGGAQHEEAQKAGDNRDVWNYFKSQLDQCIRAIKECDEWQVAYEFYILGSLAEATRDNRTPEEKISKYLAQQPLKIKQAGQATIKKLSQEYALSMWKEDSKKELRVGAAAGMAKTHIEEKYPQILHNVRQFVPKFSIPQKAQFHKWISEVAPDYAKKGGAPKKK